MPRLMNWSSPAVGAKPKLGLMCSVGVPLIVFLAIKKTLKNRSFWMVDDIDMV